MSLEHRFIASTPGGCRKSGHYYSNPSNWMWRLLKGTGIAPPHIRGAQVLLGLLAPLPAGQDVCWEVPLDGAALMAMSSPRRLQQLPSADGCTSFAEQDDRLMPADAGVGFVDVGCGVPGRLSHTQAVQCSRYIRTCRFMFIPGELLGCCRSDQGGKDTFAGTASSQFSSAVVSGWGTGFYMRLAKHTQRACEAIGCVSICLQTRSPAVAHVLLQGAQRAQMHSRITCTTQPWRALL